MSHDPRALIDRILERARPVSEAIRAAGGTPLVVGGAVRDALLGDAGGDIDLEVFGLDADALITALAPFGKVNAVGRSFGVIKLRRRGVEFDISIPRRGNRNPTGQRGAVPPPDPTMTPREAAARRDFTWNALAITPDGQILDFFDGIADLRAGVVRHVSAAFGEDPLRVLRAMQLAARFDMRLAPETAALCRALLPLAPEIALERVWGEWAKWALAAHPSAGLRALEASGWLALYPELARLQGCPQPPLHHPEGDVWTHTGYVCDAAAFIASREQLPAEERRLLLFAALCHDFGKPATTVIDADGRVRSPGHAQAGSEPAGLFLKRIGALTTIVERVLPLVVDHMSHYGQPTARAVRRLAARLAPATITQWQRLVEADHSGRPPLPPGDPAAPFVARARELGIVDGPPAPLLNGRDLIAAGYQPGPGLGPLLKRAYQAQLDGTFSTISKGLRWLEEANEQPAPTGES